eukprot:Rmarinus@m.2620
MPSVEGHLKLFYFLGHDLQRTIDFYENVLDFRVYKRVQASFMEYVYIGQSVSNKGLPQREQQTMVGLRFEFPIEIAGMATGSVEKEKAVKDEMEKPEPEIDESCRVVFYVKNLNSVVRKAQQEGVKILYGKQEYYGSTAIAGVKDPNGIHLQFVQLTLPSTASKAVTWPDVRLAYLVVVVIRGTEGMEFYEALFSQTSTASLYQQLFRDKSRSNSEDKKDKKKKSVNANNAAILLAAAAANPAETKKGFQLVDWEKFPQGESFFYWMGNVSREFGTCLCLVQTSDGKTYQANSPNTHFLGVGFAVPQLNAAISDLVETELVDFQTEEEHVAGVGTHCMFLDPNGVPVYLSANDVFPFFPHGRVRGRCGGADAYEGQRAEGPDPSNGDGHQHRAILKNLDYKSKTWIDWNICVFVQFLNLWCCPVSLPRGLPPHGLREPARCFSSL